MRTFFKGLRFRKVEGQPKPVKGQPKPVKKGFLYSFSVGAVAFDAKARAFFKGLRYSNAIVYNLTGIAIGFAILIAGAVTPEAGSSGQSKAGANQSGSAAGETNDVDELRALLGTGGSEEKSDTEELRSLLGTDSADGEASSSSSGSASGSSTGAGSSSAPDPGSSSSGSSSGFDSDFPSSGSGESFGSTPSPPATSSPTPTPVTPSPVPSTPSTPTPADSVPGGTSSGSGTPTPAEPGPDPEVVVLNTAKSGTGSIQEVGAVSGKSAGSSAEVGKDPSDVAFSRKGSKAYVVNTGSDTVSVVRLSSGKVINTIDIGKGPTSISLAPNGKRLLVSNSEASTVTLLNPTGGSKGLGSNMATIDVGASPTGAFIVDKTKAYVALADSSELAVVDIKTKAKVGQITVGSSPATVLGKDSLAYVTNRDSGSVTIINSDDNTVAKTIKVGKKPTAAALSKSGNRLYVVNEGSRSISVINTKTKKVISTFRWTNKRMKAAGAGSLKKVSLRGISFDKSTSAVFVTDIANKRLWMVNPVKKKILDKPASIGENPVVAKFLPRSKK